ncbi:MAG: hypothetical protein LKF42_09020 [Streptococcaceae bacterium]|jgi:hypothetical protein|nr:hypothetical protein [Streptococcaceae bacterium]MCH4175910.1 hypothetical protein [Streptococcaceae bacterium]
MKTDLTKEAERIVWNNTQKQGVFGCFEVTIGWFGNEIVDFITYDTSSEIKCYEIKVSKSDFLSQANKTFIGHFNYFVMPDELYRQLIAENNTVLLFQLNSYGTGVYTFGEKGWQNVKKAKRRRVNYTTIAVVLESMLRSTSREVKKYYKIKPYWEIEQEGE